MKNYSLGIVGSRHYGSRENDYEEFKQVINEIIKICGNPTRIVSGGHLDKYKNNKPGADTLAWLWSIQNNIPIIEHEAEWNKYNMQNRSKHCVHTMIKHDSETVFFRVVEREVNEQEIN